VKVIIGGAFDSGLLVASGGEPLRYDYADAPHWAVERAETLRKTCAAFDTDLPAVALQFCKAHPAVVSVIPGARTAEEVRQVARWAQARIAPDLWLALKDLALISPNAVVPS
jgi:D-threo-aldose 1-dehydrogenase